VNSNRFFIFFFHLGLFFATAVFGDSISSNPGAVNISTGTGKLGELLGLKIDSGVRLGGLLIEDANYLFCGGVDPRKWSGNSLFILDLNLNTEKLKWWQGGAFGAEFLQFNGQPTNDEAGTVQGYNSLVASPPFGNRSELYQIWFRQEFFCKKFIFRIGKSIPSYDFNNVIRPLLTGVKGIPATTGLIYTPIYVNSSLLGVLPGYYNSAYGICLTIAPKEDIYINYGIYDGNLARGEQTGLRVGPRFNAYRFQIIEVGYGWAEKKYPGDIGVGGWNQSGTLTTPNGVTEHGCDGLYLFGSQRLWWRNYEKDNSGINGFIQAGVNDSKTLPATAYGGAGLTFLGLLPNRIDDSFGIGMALARLNPRQFDRPSELILQGYYQARLFADAYFVSAISYIPNPGLAEHLKSACAGTARIILLF